MFYFKQQMKYLFLIILLCSCSSYSEFEWNQIEELKNRYVSFMKFKDSQCIRIENFIETNHIYCSAISANDNPVSFYCTKTHCHL